MVADPQTVTRLVELSALAVAAAFAYHAARRGEIGELITLAVAGWLSEEVAMAAYGYYGYGDRWLILLHRTPLAVVLVWPIVVSSSLALARRWQTARARGVVALALVTAALVVYDTLVLEPVATRLGLWWWKDGSYFGVPLLGVLGWGMFGVAAAVVLRWPRPAWLPDLAWAPLVRPAIIGAITHVQLAAAAVPSIALGATVALGDAAYAAGVAAIAVLLVPVGWRLRHLGVTPRDIVFKIAGSAIFFALIYYYWLWPFAWYCALVPLPYWALTFPNALRRRAPTTERW